MTQTVHAARSTRRTAISLVLLAVLSCLVVYGTVFFDGSASSLLAIAGGIAWFASYFGLRRLVQEAADLPDDRLDEREIAVRDRSYLEAYRLLGGAVGASLVLAMVDDAVGDVVQSWNGAWAALLLLSAVLPSAVLAYRQHSDD
jgi:hypothetical protein